MDVALWNALFFAGLATAVWATGTTLTRLADAIADRFGLGRSIVGVLFLATATSLPEVVTTFAGALRGEPELVLNNLFGGIVLQTAILAVADCWSRGAITNAPRKSEHILEAGLLIVLLAVLQVVLILDEPVAVFSFGLGSVAVVALYAVAVMMLRRYDRLNDWVPVDLPPTPAAREIAVDVSTSSRTRLLGRTVATCGLIVVLGSALVWSAERLASDTGLGSSFVGVTMLALATSLPELSTTVAAVRMGAHTLAISNVFGSNLIMVVLIGPADLLTDVPILREASSIVQLAVAFGIVVTGFYLVGLVVRRKIALAGIGLDSVAVLVAYVLSLVTFYLAR